MTGVPAADLPPERLVFAAGHYLGPHHREQGAAPAGHRIRLGPSLRWLTTEAELLAWMLGHGLGELADEEPWTAATLVAHAQQLAGVDVADAVAGLLARRLLVEVDPDRDGSAAEFARAYRLRPLMVSLGPAPDEPDEMLLGLPGQPMVALSHLGHQVWQASQVAGNLWETCQAVAQADSAQDMDKLLPELLSELHGLVGAGVAYLDLAESGAMTEGAGTDAGVEVD